MIETIFQNEKTSVGYLCTATPPEIIHAAGGRPFRLTGTGTNMETAERLAHPNLCSFCKSALSWVNALPVDHRIITLTASCCDGCRRIGALFETMDQVSGNISLDLPRTGSKKDVVYYAQQLKIVFKELTEKLNTSDDENALVNSIGLYQRMRGAFREILTAVYEGRLEPRAAFDTAASYQSAGPEEFFQTTSNIMKSAAENPAVSKGPKVILSGNMVFGSELAQLIKNLGGQIVGLDFCNVDRAAQMDVQITGTDPFYALAKAVYARPLCPRFEPHTGWATRLGENVKATGARAVILHSLKFCDNTLYGFPATREHLESLGTAVLTLEGEFTEGLPGQITTRVEAFLEML